MKCFNAFDVIGARNEIRTRDPDLGKVVLYQLSYSRLFFLVREERLELSHPKIPDPKSGASANSATLAYAITTNNSWVVRAGRLELPHPEGHKDLNLARLPFRHARAHSCSI